LANDGITIYVALGENKKAIRFLQKAADEHVGWVVRLGIDPALDSLRAEPDFNKLKERIGGNSRGSEFPPAKRLNLARSR
jgi:hypothetical protein